MPIEICNVLTPSCFPDWNGVAAIATAAATASALLIPSWLRCKDRHEKNQALAYSLLLKVIKIHSDIFKFWEHIKEQRQLATQHNATPDTWGFFRPLASLPTNVRFTSDELAVLFSTKDNDTLNLVLSLDEVHAQHLANLHLYSERRHALMLDLPGGELNGTFGGIDLTAEQYARFAPFSLQLDMLVADIAAGLERHITETEAALRQLSILIKSKFKMKIEVVLPLEPTAPA